MTACTVRDPTAADEPVWRRLWADYCDFYGTTVAEAVTAATWAKIVHPNPEMHTRLAIVDGATVGFANTVLHLTTWTTARDAYLEDLFVARAVRGRGIGRALLDDLIARCRLHGWSRLSWHTGTANTTARLLYDSYAPAEDLVRYRLKMPPC